MLCFAASAMHATTMVHAGVDEKQTEHGQAIVNASYGPKVFCTNLHAKGHVLVHSDADLRANSIQRQCWSTPPSQRRLLTRKALDVVRQAGPDLVRLDVPPRQGKSKQKVFECRMRDAPAWNNLHTRLHRKIDVTHWSPCKQLPKAHNPTQWERGSRHKEGERERERERVRDRRNQDHSQEWALVAIVLLLGHDPELEHLVLLLQVIAKRALPGLLQTHGEGLR